MIHKKSLFILANISIAILFYANVAFSDSGEDADNGKLSPAGVNNPKNRQIITDANKAMDRNKGDDQAAETATAGTEGALSGASNGMGLIGHSWKQGQKRMKAIEKAAKMDCQSRACYKVKRKAERRLAKMKRSQDNLRHQYHKLRGVKGQLSGRGHGGRNWAGGHHGGNHWRGGHRSADSGGGSHGHGGWRGSRGGDDGWHGRGGGDRSSYGGGGRDNGRGSQAAAYRGSDSGSGSRHGYSGGGRGAGARAGGYGYAGGSSGSSQPLLSQLIKSVIGNDQGNSPQNNDNGNNTVAQPSGPAESGGPIVENHTEGCEGAGCNGLTVSDNSQSGRGSNSNPVFEKNEDFLENNDREQIAQQLAETQGQILQNLVEQKAQQMQQRRLASLTPAMPSGNFAAPSGFGETGAEAPAENEDKEGLEKGKVLSTGESLGYNASGKSGGKKAGKADKGEEYDLAEDEYKLDLKDKNDKDDEKLNVAEFVPKFDPRVSFKEFEEMQAKEPTLTGAFGPSLWEKLQWRYEAIKPLMEQ